MIKKSEVYEGVLLEELLQKAAAPHGEQLRGKLMATYVTAESEDGHRVVLALAELDSGFLDSEVLVAEMPRRRVRSWARSGWRRRMKNVRRALVRMLKLITVVSRQESE